MKRSSLKHRLWIPALLVLLPNPAARSDLARADAHGRREAPFAVKHTTSRNNILHVRTPQNHSASAAQQNTDNDFNYDLYNGRIPQAQETHGTQGEPDYAADAGFDSAAKTGRFQLAPASPGAGAGQPIPNFSQGYSGPAPDIGAHQRGAPPLRYGVDAARHSETTR